MLELHQHVLGSCIFFKKKKKKKKKRESREEGQKYQERVRARRAYISHRMLPEQQHSASKISMTACREPENIGFSLSLSLS